MTSYSYNDRNRNPIVAEETVHNLFCYSGEYWDDSTGLQYLRARWYDPSVGRFINEDSYEGSINNPLSLNLYTYVSNNPLTHVDPSGHMQVKALQSISTRYNLGRIANGNLAPMVLVANGLESSKGIQNVTVFHDIAQIIAAKQVYKAFAGGRVLMPALEVPLKSGREIDIMWKDQIWEVKPFGTSAEEQLKAYTEEGNYIRGKELDPVKDFHLYGNLFMSVYFTSPGVVNYSLNLKQDGKTTNLSVIDARSYVNNEYAERSRNAGLAQAGVIGAFSIAGKVVQGAGAVVRVLIKEAFSW